MNVRTSRTHCIGWLLALVVAACGQPAARAPAGAARRIVSLAPSITELLFALGAGNQLVGRTTYCRYPPAALAVPSVGDGLNPSVEAILARNPDLVLLYRSPHTDLAARQLAALGVRALVIHHDRLEDIALTARRLGEATGHPEAGAAIARTIDSVLAVPPPPDLHVRMAFIVWDNPPIVIGGGSYLDQLTGLAGVRNAFHDIATPSATVSLETVAFRDPDWIGVVREGGDSAPPAYAARPEWQAVRAVRERRFLLLPAELFGQPSARAPEAVQWLRRQLTR
jgi:ABC-type Fe3+-hydroxamate transport system substrate-binding protein